jgi:hypothetical protein
MCAARLLLVCLFVMPAVARSADPPKHAVPDGDALKKADATIKELFKADYAKNKGSDRKVLVAKLLKVAGTEKDPVARFALLCEARDIDAQLGNFEPAMQTVHTIASDYDVDETKELAEIIRTSFKVTNLSKSDLAILAAGELSKPTESKPATELAEAWALYAGQENGRVKSLLLGRAVKWYAVAAVDVSGLARKEIENKKMRMIATIEDADEKGGRWTLWEGKWQAKYGNGAVRTYAVGKDGQVYFEEGNQTTRLVRAKDGIHVKFPDNKLERLRHLGNEIDVDHFWPAQDYPKKVTVKGTASREPARNSD